MAGGPLATWYVRLGGVAGAPVSAPAGEIESSWACSATPMLEFAIELDSTDIERDDDELLRA